MILNYPFLDTRLIVGLGISQLLKFEVLVPYPKVSNKILPKYTSPDSED